MSLEQHDRLEIEAAGATDVGMKRRLNEDVVVLDTGNEVFVVADHKIYDHRPSRRVRRPPITGNEARRHQEADRNDQAAKRTLLSIAHHSTTPEQTKE